MSEYDYDKAPTNPHHGGKMTPTDMVRRIEELEANLAKAVEALEGIAHVCVGDAARCGSKAALADLTGDTNE